jgi:hypothetical protein
MKTKLILAICLIASAILNAQKLTLTAKTGDAELDGNLVEMNTTAKTDLSGFKANLTAEFNLSGAKIDIMLGKMEPADVFMNAKISIIIGKPIDNVIVVYEKNRGKGWGVIAKELGIKPGSKEFHALKDATKAKNKEWKASKGKSSSGSPGNSGKSKGKGKK